eukprot:1559555-Prymnesium_polylepis.1
MPRPRLWGHSCDRSRRFASSGQASSTLARGRARILATFPTFPLRAALSTVSPPLLSLVRGRP